MDLELAQKNCALLEELQPNQKLRANPQNNTLSLDDRWGPGFLRRGITGDSHFDIVDPILDSIDALMNSGKYVHELDNLIPNLQITLKQTYPNWPEIVDALQVLFEQNQVDLASMQAENQASQSSKETGRTITNMILKKEFKQSFIDEKEKEKEETCDATGLNFSALLALKSYHLQ